MTNAYQEGREARELNIFRLEIELCTSPLTANEKDILHICSEYVKIVKGWRDKHYELADELSG